LLINCRSRIEGSALGQSANPTSAIDQQSEICDLPGKKTLPVEQHLPVKKRLPDK